MTNWEPLAPGLKSIEDALEIRRRVLLAFELAERQMQEHGWHPPLNFVVIGGGPTGVELAGAIRDISQLFMRHDFRHIDPAKARVLLLDAGPRVLAAYPPDLSAKAEAALTHLGVEVHTHTHVTGVGPGWVEAGGNRIDSAVTLWAAGVQASPLGKLLGVPTRPARLRPGRRPPQSPRPARMSSSSATSPTSSRTAARSPASPSPPCRWATTSAR